MKEIDIHQPYDKLFKAAFSKKEVAIDFFKNRLPASIQSKIDLNDLQLESSSFVSEELKDSHSDLLYSVKVGKKKAYLYLLVEQQTVVEQRQALRLLKYNVEIMERHLNQGGKTLPSIFNLVLYTGRKKYRGPRTLLDAFENPTQFLDILQSKFIISLEEEDDSKILQDKKAALAEFVLKQAEYREFCTFLAEHKQVRILLNSSSYFMPTVLFMASRDKHRPEDIIKIANLDPITKEKIMSGLERMQREAKQKGKAEGIQETILKLIRAGFDKKLLERGLKVDEASGRENSKGGK